MSFLDRHLLGQSPPWAGTFLDRHRLGQAHSWAGALLDRHFPLAFEAAVFARFASALAFVPPCPRWFHLRAAGDTVYVSEAESSRVTASWWTGVPNLICVSFCTSCLPFCRQNKLLQQSGNQRFCFCLDGDEPWLHVFQQRDHLRRTRFQVISYSRRG